MILNEELIWLKICPKILKCCTLKIYWLWKAHSSNTCTWTNCKSYLCRVPWCTGRKNTKVSTHLSGPSPSDISDVLMKQICFQWKRYVFVFNCQVNSWIFLSQIYLLIIISTTIPGLFSSFFFSGIKKHFPCNTYPNSAQYSIVPLTLMSIGVLLYLNT